ncbi:MAG: hypothetical protein AUJ52_13945 [Elusimicrobia bacterium CG1_02_63_36]|nr:MAG: hypothetical protein AUJ52_13945 [Elusimicrobia bacterium CG1_02_63_36]
MIRAAGIIGAGLGSRLANSHPGIPKPLVELGGRPLVCWVLDGLREAGINSVTLLHNSSGDAIPGVLRAAFPDFDFRFLRADTASSWESFRLVASSLAETEERFLMSTVDVVAPPGEVRRFAQRAAEADAALALTRFVEDEKPLWADCDQDGFVDALGEDATVRETVTCGLYALSRAVAGNLKSPDAYARLRNFWTELVRSRTPVLGIVLSDTVDLDRPEDFKAARALIAETAKRNHA